MPHTKSNSLKWRVALLLTTISMGIALIISGVSGYVQAQRASETLAKSEVMGMLHGLRRAVGKNRDASRQVIMDFLLDAKEQGLNYIAFVDGNGLITTEFGEPTIPFDNDFLQVHSARRPGRKHGLRGPSSDPVVFDNGVVHTVLPVPRRMRIPRLRTDFGTPILVAVEVESTDGPGIVAGALVALAVESIAAVLLLGASILFWRLSVKQERQAQAMAQERLDMLTELEKDKRLKALGQMSAVLGHQLKNPIASLKGHAQLLAEKLESTHRGKPQAETVLREALLLETLTTQILDYARTGELTISKVYLDDLAFSAVELSGVPNVTVHVPDDSVWYLDRRQIEQVIVNLLTNARQASSENEPISLFFVESDTSLEIAVRDKGAGFEDGDEHRIFEPFYTKRIEGTGLGLALAKRVVESHNGTISANNHEDGGAEIMISLPRIKGETHG